MRKSITSVPFRATKSQAVASQVVTPQERTVMRVVTTPFSLDPEYQEKITSYTLQLNEKVTNQFIENPVLLTNIYELLGMLPFEIQDIERNVRAKEYRQAMIEVDDLIEKVVAWRIKLSHKLSA